VATSIGVVSSETWQWLLCWRCCYISNGGDNQSVAAKWRSVMMKIMKSVNKASSKSKQHGGAVAKKMSV